MNMLQSAFYALDLLGLAWLVIAASFVCVEATCDDGPVMRRWRRR